MSTLEVKQGKHNRYHSYAGENVDVIYNIKLNRPRKIQLQDFTFYSYLYLNVCLYRLYDHQRCSEVTSIVNSKAKKQVICKFQQAIITHVDPSTNRADI